MDYIATVSQITSQNLADYINICEASTLDLEILDTLKNVAISFIQNYTGKTDLDEYPDYIIVVLILVQDMWDNRTLYVDKNNLNKVVESILGMHSINLLPND